MAVFDNSFFPVKDFAYSTVATAPSPDTSGTSLVVAAGEGALFPAPATAGVFRAYVWAAGTLPTQANCEEIEVTAISTDTFTIVRQKNGVSRAIVVGDQIAINLGKSKEDQILTAIKDGVFEDKLLPGESYSRDSTTQFKTPGDKTGWYTNGRVLRINNAGTYTSHIVLSSSYSAPNTTVLITTADLPAALTNIYLAIQTKGHIPVGSNSFVINETPSGTVNGSNAAFDTASNYVAGSIQVYRDGQLMKGGGADYTETDSNTITFTTAPATGSVLLVSYQKTVSTAGNADTVDGYHANATPTANNIPVLDANAKLPNSILAAEAWTTYDPTLTNITLGNGTKGGSYIRIGNTVFFRIYFAYGSSGSAVGTNPAISLPVTAANTELNITECTLYSGATVFLGRAFLNDTAKLTLYSWVVTGTHITYEVITATAPGTWANGNYMRVAGYYEAA